MLIEFSYMYRDGDNYKTSGSLVLAVADGTDLKELEKQLRELMEDGEYFIAHQLGIEEVAPWARGGGVSAVSDHCWHEFCDLVQVQEYSGPVRPLADLVEALGRAKEEGWKEFDVGLRVNSAVQFSRQELELLAEALDSHIYWQIAGEDPNHRSARQNGIVYDLRVEDPEVRQRLASARQLEAKLHAALESMGEAQAG